LFPVPETEAVGVPDPGLIFNTANFAEAVETPPTKTSSVVFPVYNVPLAVCHGSKPPWQVPLPVTIPLTTVTQDAAPIVAPAVPLIRRLLPLFRLKLISPVDAVPKVRVSRFVVPILPKPSNERAFAPEL